MSNSETTVRFKEFTIESMKAIKERILNEKQCLEIESDDMVNDPTALKKPRKKHKKVKKVEKKANSDFETGKLLPEKFKNLLSTKLFGIPIEEIDEYYQNDYVIQKRKLIRQHFSNVKFVNFI